MRTNHALAITIVIAIFLSSCKRNYVSIDYTNAKGEVPQLGNLVFRFNKALHPDSLLNNWDSSEYISFEPSIPGRFRWEGPEELVFSPSQPLAPATTYHVKFKDEIFRYSQYDKVKDDDVSFYTAPLQLNDAQLTWLSPSEGSNVAMPQIMLRFNYPIKADDLKDKLQLEVDGEKAAYSIQNTGITSEVGVRLTTLKPEDKSYDAKIILDAGLKPDKGSNSTKDIITQSLTIPSPYVLNISEVEAEHNGTEGTVSVYTSQQLTNDNINNYISFSPAVSFTVEHTDFGVILTSDKFDVEKSYAINIAKGLRGQLGGSLKEDYNGAVGFGQLESDIKFTNSKAVYLSKQGAGNIKVRITNTPKVKLVISKIYENNLLSSTTYGYEPKDNDEPQYATNQSEEGEYNNYGDAVVGDVIYTKEINTNSLPKSGAGRLLNISQFEDRLPDAKGIYHVMIRSDKDYWVRDTRFLSFSDIGLIAKQGKDNIIVFANSIKNATAINGVTINLYGKNNQLLGTGSTNNDGVAEIKVASKSFAGYAPSMIIAKTADDFTYLPFNSTRVNTSRFDVGGKKANPTGLDAFVYAERDIYRPGEKLNYALVVRERNWKPAVDLPVKIKFLLPNGKELKTFRKGLNEQGATEGSMDISSSAITGSYTMEVYSSNDVLLATKNFMIEEFVPDRIKVTAKLDKPFLLPSETTTLSINAVNFFGPPAANRKFENETQIKQKAFTAKKYSDYDFTLANQKSFTDKDVKQGTTDENGNANVTFEVPSMYENMGLLQANFYTTVFDETGRPVSRLTSADIFTQDVFNGIKNDYYDYYPLNSVAKFSLVSLNKDGVPTNATATVQIVKHEYKTVLSKSGNFFRYDSQKEDKIISERQMTIGDKTDYSFIPHTPGDYEIRVYRPNANTYVSKSFYSYGSWGSEASSFEVNTEGYIDISADKEKYNAGETAKLLFKTPFSGRMLVTVEREGVLSHEYINVEKRTASMDLKLASEHVPNVYVTATLIKPHDVTDMPLTVAHGFQNISVEEKDRRIGVQITAQKSSRSRTHQKVLVKAIPGSFVSLAAVDNGVLQVSDFKTPDPYNFYYQKAALGVMAYDMYPLLFPELRARLSSTGGDAMSMEKRVNPMPAKRFKIMSYWSGLKKADGSGNVNFEFDIPQFSGQVRLMAVAFKDEKFGNAEATTTVADPIVISSSLPRFISPGDTVLVPVTISNTTNRTANGNANITVTGPVKVVSNNAQTIAINANSEGRTTFQIVANANVDVAKITVGVNALNEKFVEETEIAVRPPSTLQKLSGSGSIAGEQSQTITIPQSDFMAGSFKYDLVISRSPVAQVADQLQWLVTYPYGCTEQTVSAAFPQLYYGDFVDALKLNPENKQNAAYNVMEAIRKIKMRQLYNGAVTLWDGEDKEDWWATIYAAHFLWEAKKAGYDVDNSLLETMLSYLLNRLKTKETIEYYYNRDQHRRIAPKEVAYSLYVLALANRPQASTMNYYKASGSTMLALDSKYLLSAAYAVSGDRRSFTSLLPASFSGEESVQQTGGSYYSALRDEAISLNSLIDVDPGNGQIPQMAQHVSTRLKNDRYANTQERAFSFLALGKLARSAAKSNVTADIRMNGKTIASVDDKDWKGSSDALKTNAVEIVTKGTGRLYYSWIAEGVSISGAYKQEDNYIKVRRQFYDRNGALLNGTTFKQNDLIIVGITLEKAYDNEIDNIVITDLLPAGFEIENPRTKEIPGMDWIKDGNEPRALDVRDDRIHFFVDAYNARQKYYYAVRAVSLGQFKQGPVSADAMYNGEIHSYNGAQMIRITQ